MRPAQIVVDVVNAGDAVWVEAGHLKAKHVPARLVPVIREHKASLLALLSPQPFTPLPSEECADAYAMAERLAIMAEDDLPPDRGWADVAGFENMPDLSPSEHGAILRRLMNPAPAESMDGTTTRPPMQPAPAMATCGSCARFQPGPQLLSIGVCLATVDGQPPKDQRGYMAAYPMAQRRCPEYAGVQHDL